ncbi:MAG: MBL fold metallo-hydrolase [Clostridia bacterium]|nr:MBL fold metallo-hydrolase [Clostridia bacterium]MBQ1375324.1 MBL fold metallo-hydrolase [Clostridia bacterium]MBQ4250268.1 MBL fold metallo-hydrolase [Clostridia bacterium]
MLKGMNITVGPLETNCYLVYDEADSVCVIIDPGEEALTILDVLRTLKLDAQAILLTHTHFDHIGAVRMIQDALDIPVYVNPNETNIKDSWKNVHLVNDGDKLTIGKLTYEFLLTPGHSEGSMCIKVDETIFSGDTLFRENCGRCDLPGGDYKQMLKSLKRLSLISGNFAVFPGHGPKTTLNYERMNNPYMRESRYAN